MRGSNMAKAYLARSIIFLLLGVAILHGLAFVALTINPDGTTTFLQIDQKNLEVVLNHKNSVEAIVLGSSHGDDIDFSSMNYDGLSLARAWGDLFEVQYYLNYLVTRLPELKVVFIPVSFFTLDWDNAYIKEVSLRRSQIYETIPSWLPISGDYKNYIIGKGTKLIPIQTILREDNWQGVFHGLLFKGIDETNQPASDNCEYLDQKALAKLSRSRAEEQIEFTNEVRLERPDIRKNTLQVLREIISYLDRNKITVVFFSPPYYKEYIDYYKINSPDSITHLTETMSNLNSEFLIYYFDFSLDNRFSSDFTLFKDADHLNSCGKKLFSILLYKNIKNTSVQR